MPPRAARARPWTSGLGVTLVEVLEDARETLLGDPGIRQALLDGIDRGLTGEPPAFPGDADVYALRGERRSTGASDGIVVIARGCPRVGEAAVLAVGVAPASRGRALATKALLLVERSLIEEGVTRVLVRVPRTNGRGLYYLLRCGYTPLTGKDVPVESGDASWFARRRPPG